MAVAVVDDAARRRQRNRPEPVRLRLQLVFPVSQDLRAEERHYQDAEQDPHGCPRGPQAPVEQMRVEGAHAMLRRGCNQSRRNQSMATPTSAVVMLCSGDQTSSSHPACAPCSRPDASSTMKLRIQTPAKNRQPLTNTCSAKKPAFAHDDANPTRVCASMPAPKLAGVIASRRRPRINPAAALFPGCARIA